MCVLGVEGSGGGEGVLFVINEELTLILFEMISVISSRY